MKKIFGLILVLAIVIGVGFISLSNKNTRGNKGDVKILAVIAKNYGANFNLLLDDFNALGYKTVLTGITKKISSCPWATGMGLPELTVDSLISEDRKSVV